MAIAAIHPGEHLAEELEALNMSAAELARQIKVPTNRITAIMHGQRAITFVAMYEAATIPEMAAELPPARRAELYRQLVRQVGRIKVERLLSSSAKTIMFSMRVPAKGSTATFTFTFEDKAPFRISGVDMEVSQR